MQNSQDTGLKQLVVDRALALRYGVAAFGGLLLTTAFPKTDLAAAAWIAPAVILFNGAGAAPRRAFKLGYIAGLVHFLTSLHWLLNMPYTFHGVPLAPALAWFSLSAYCALYPAIWVWLCWSIWPGETMDVSFVAALQNLFSRGALRRQVWTLACGAIWVGLEMIRGRFLTGFPWDFLGVSQYRMLPLIQIASTTGVYGLSFLIAWVSTALGAAALRACFKTTRGSATRDFDRSRGGEDRASPERAVRSELTKAPGKRPAAQPLVVLKHALSLMRRPMPMYGLWGEAAVPLLAAAAVTVYGASQLVLMAPAGRQLKIALVQPSMPQTLIWDPQQNASRFAQIMRLSEQAAAAKPDLMIWPESGLPAVTPEIQNTLSNFITRQRLWMVVCADDQKISPDGTSEYFNAGFLIGPTAATEGICHKRRLVIFGEYVPLAKWLPFLNWVTPVDTGYAPGTESVQFQMEHPSVKLSVLICFEDIFAQEAREHVKPDTDFLVNLTNDGWFGESAEQWQQAASAIFRAVENGVPLVRCTNNGLTCWIDAHGRLRKILTATDGSVYGEGFMIADVPLRSSGELNQTFYNRHGDWFAWTCCAITAMLVVAVTIGRRTTGFSRT